MRRRAPAPEARASTLTRSLRSPGLASAACGLLAVTLQTAMLRELVVALAGDELGIGVCLALWLAGVAAGALAVRLGAAGAGGGAPLAASLTLLIVATAWGASGSRVVFALAAAPAGEYVGLLRVIVWAIAVFLPAGAVIGAAFTSLSEATSGAADAAPTRVYGFEALGFLLGGLACSVLVGNVAGSTAVSATTSGIVAAVLVFAVSEARRVLRAALAALAIASLALAAASPAVDDLTRGLSFRARSGGATLSAWRESPRQLIEVAAGPDHHVYLGGRYAMTVPDPYVDEVRSHRLACLVERPARVLVVTMPSLGLARHLLRHGVERLEILVEDPALVETLASISSAADLAALGDPALILSREDPRARLRHGGRRFDLILIPDPTADTLLLSRLGTLEFFELVARRLAPRGVVVAELPTPPNALEGPQARAAASVFAAARRVLDVVASPGPDGLLVGALPGGRPTLDPAVLARRWERRGLDSDVFAGALFADAFPVERCRAHRRALAALAETTGISSDARPVSLLHSLDLRARRRAGSGRGAGPSALLSRTEFLVAVLVLPSAACLCLTLLRRGRRRRLALAHFMAVAGVSGIGWWLVLLFGYQIARGGLYWALGLLSGGFMAGLAGGALIGLRGNVRPIVASASGCVLAAGLGILAQGAPVAAGGLVVFVALVVCAGLVCGIAFPACAAPLAGEGLGRAEIASRLAAADHAGAAPAALLVCVALIPAFGIPGTLFLFAVLQGFALLGLIVADA